MDAKDLRTESALSERNNDGSKYSQSGGIALHCDRNKSYQDIGSNSLGKVDVQGARPCAVIGPDRVVPPSAPNEAYIKKGPAEPWPCIENAYHTRRPPEYPHKLANFQNPTRNISPRQTFQENMQRIMVQPSYNSVKLNDDNNYVQISDRSNALPKNIKINMPPEAKFCDVPYTVYPTNNEQKNVRNSDMCVSSVNPTLTRTAPHGWPPGSVNIRPTRTYGAPEVYQYQDYPSCAGPRPPVPRPNRAVPEEPGYVYADSFYHQEGNIRFKPYPTVKDRFPQQRYEYISNYANSFHPPPPFPAHKYELQKSVPPHPYPPYPPIKYIDRVPEPVIDGYQRNQQNNYNMPYRNQIIHPNYGPVIGNCPQNKLHSYPPDAHIKTLGPNKLPFDNSKGYIEYDNGRSKMYPPEGYLVNEMGRVHPMKSQVIMPNYPSLNMHNMPQNPYFKKDNQQIKNYEYLQAHFRTMDPNINMHNPMIRHQPVFSPNTSAISPADSNTSNDTSQTLGASQEDCGYVSQSSTASARSIDSGINRIPNDYIRKYYDNRYGPIIRTVPMMSKSEINSNNHSKEKKNIDVRQFLQMWKDEGDEEAEENNSKDIIIQCGNKTDTNFIKTHEVINQPNQEQLYVLGLVNVPSEELGKYDHIQKVSKLPENIKGYNHLELLNQFEEAIESSNMANYKSSTPKDYQITSKTIPQKQATAVVPPRPLSPLDVEAKISQSVIHKEVGCNFEIKPCSPKMLNVEVATPVQNILAERAIEKVANPVMLKSPRLNSLDENMDCTIMKRKEHRININNEPVRIPSCKMVNTQFSNNSSVDSIKNSYSLQDLESNSGLCLASLPRLDNDIELNFPEVNQQFINANKAEPCVSTSLRDLPSLELLDQSDNQIKSKQGDTNTSADVDETLKSPCIVDSEKEISKLSKYRKNKTTLSDSKENQNVMSAINAARTDSVIIKNPENTKNYEDKESILPNSVNRSITNTQQGPINLTSQGYITENTDKTATNTDSHVIPQFKETDTPIENAIDFSLNKNCTNKSSNIQIKSTQGNEICTHSAAEGTHAILDHHLNKASSHSNCDQHTITNKNKIYEEVIPSPAIYSDSEAIAEMSKDKQVLSYIENPPLEEIFSDNKPLLTSSVVKVVDILDDSMTTKINKDEINNDSTNSLLPIEFVSPDTEVLQTSSVNNNYVTERKKHNIIETQSSTSNVFMDNHLDDNAVKDDKCFTNNAVTNITETIVCPEATNTQQKNTADLDNVSNDDLNKIIDSSVVEPHNKVSFNLGDKCFTNNAVTNITETIVCPEATNTQQKNTADLDNVSNDDLNKIIDSSVVEPHNKVSFNFEHDEILDHNDSLPSNINQVTDYSQNDDKTTLNLSSPNNMLSISKKEKDSNSLSSKNISLFSPKVCPSELAQQEIEENVKLLSPNAETNEVKDGEQVIHETDFKNNLPSSNNTDTDCVNDYHTEVTKLTTPIRNSSTDVRRDGQVDDCTKYDISDVDIASNNISYEIKDDFSQNNDMTNEAATDQIDFSSCDVIPDEKELSKDCKIILSSSQTEDRKFTYTLPSRYLSYGGKEMYSPWFQKLVLFSEGNSNDYSNMSDNYTHNPKLPETEHIIKSCDLNNCEKKEDNAHILHCKIDNLATPAMDTYMSSTENLKQLTTNECSKIDINNIHEDCNSTEDDKNYESDKHFTFNVPQKDNNINKSPVLNISTQNQEITKNISDSLTKSVLQNDVDKKYNELDTPPNFDDTKHLLSPDVQYERDSENNCNDDIREQWDSRSHSSNSLSPLHEEYTENELASNEVDEMTSGKDTPIDQAKSQYKDINDMNKKSNEQSDQNKEEISKLDKHLDCNNDILVQWDQQSVCSDDISSEWQEKSKIEVSVLLDKVQSCTNKVGNQLNKEMNNHEVQAKSEEHENCSDIVAESSAIVANTEFSSAKVPITEQSFLNKKRQPLKRSLSDSALNCYNDNEMQQENEENVQFIWPFKRRKIINNDILAQDLCNIIQNNRRNSISTICNEENVSFCILIDNGCIITEEENDEEEKICYTELTEECMAEIQNDDTNDQEHTEAMPDIESDISTLQTENVCEYTDSFLMHDENEKLEESWVEDVACVETVISDDIAEDIEISGPISPKDDILSDNDESGVFSSSEHTEKVKFIYGDKMCNDDAQFVETLYNTPQMDVTKTLVQRESLISAEYYDNDSLEKILSESNDHESAYVPEYIEPVYSPGLIDNKEAVANKENMIVEIIPPLQHKVNALDVIDTGLDDIHQENVKLCQLFDETQNDTIHSCESSVDNVFSYKDNDEDTNYTSSSPEVSSTTSEERKSAILLKITNYQGSRISQINDINRDSKRPSCKFTEDKDYVQSQSNFNTHRPLLTKAAQKYIPPLKETMRDLKVKLSLPQHSLIKLKQLKNSKDEPKVCKQNITVPRISKKPKPKFEDVLKSIDEIQIKMHKEKTKKSKKIIPKVVIKKNENGSHYASTSNKDEFNPDLTGRKWQPWVFIEKNHFIDKMAIKKKTKAVYSHRKRTYVLAEKFQKYRSVNSSKFVISPPLSDCPSAGLKYTIRLKHY